MTINTSGAVSTTTPFTISAVSIPEDDGDPVNARYREKQKLHFAELNNMYMTGKDIDAVIKRVSYTVSEGRIRDCAATALQHCLQSKKQNCQ